MPRSTHYPPPESVEPSIWHGPRWYLVTIPEGNDRALYRRCTKWGLRKAIRELRAMYDDDESIHIEREPLPMLGVSAGVVIPVTQRMLF